MLSEALGAARMFANNRYHVTKITRKDAFLRSACIPSTLSVSQLLSSNRYFFFISFTFNFSHFRVFRLKPACVVHPETLPARSLALAS